MKRRLIALACAALAALALAAPAGAACVTSSSVTQDQYGDTSRQLDRVCDDGGSGGSPDGSGLPFTGLDLGLLALGATALLGAGIALRRRPAGPTPGGDA